MVQGTGVLAKMLLPFIVVAAASSGISFGLMAAGVPHGAQT